jgi:hypothetical protein
VPLPDELRKRLRLEPGAEVPDWRSMEGMLGDGPSLTEALVEDHAAELEDERNRL